MTYIKRFPWDYDLEEAMRKYGMWVNTKYPYKNLVDKHDKIPQESNQHSTTVDTRQ